MPIEIKFLVFQVLILIPFILGTILKKKITRPAEFARKLIRFNLAAITPPVVLWSIWGLTIHMDLLYLPLAGITLVLLGFILGRLSLPLLRREGKSKATWLISSSLANHGFTMGGFICYLFVGEKGLGLSSIFLIYFMPYIFLVIFPFSRRASRGTGHEEKKQSVIPGLKEFFRDPQNLTLYAVFAALLLHLFSTPRPDIYFPIDILLMISISLYYFTLGINFTFGDVRAIKREHLLLAAIKFLILPVITYLLLRIVNLDKDVEQVILIESCMPAAVYSVVSSILYDLDSPLASGLFVANTILFIFLVLPVLFMTYIL
ncbi:MAG: hypothetical protein GY754_13505 [bacterium]|nr:hypothetical protein [bacterium]